MTIEYRDCCKKCWKPLTLLDWIKWPFNLCEECKTKEKEND